MKEDKEMRALNMHRTTLIERAFFEPEEIALLDLT